MRAYLPGLAVAVLVSLAACGGDDEHEHDAPVEIDAPADIDAPAAPTCAAYCTTIAANCTADNNMYPATAECMATCALFGVGTSADMAGNTLGCRLYHANNA